MIKYLFLFFFACQLNSAFAAEQTYTVRAGDTVLKIADRQLGGAGKDPRRYALAKQIVAKNPSLKDGNALTPGQVLVLPESTAPATAGAVAPSVTAAKEAAVAAPATAAPVAPAPTLAAEPAEHIEKAVQEADAHKAAAAETAHEAQAHAEAGAHEAHANFLILQPRLGLTDFHTKDKATGEKAELHKQMFTGLNVGYGFALGAHSHLVVEAGIAQAKVKSVVEDDFTIESKTLSLKNFAVGYETGLTPSLHLHLVAQLNDYLILGPTEVADNYAPRIVQQPVAEVGLGWNFVQMSSSVLGLSAAAEYVFPGKEGGVKYKTGVEPAAGLYWATQNSDKMNYRVDLRYQPSAQKSDFTEQHGTGYGLRLGLIIPL